jgi:hypothetical protein
MNTTSLPLRFGRSVRQLYRYAFLDSFDIVRRQGWRELLRQRGWKFFAAILAYYIVRDTVLYILIPLCLARGLF